jgi:RCC1 and BTB domain-containing protein
MDLGSWTIFSLLDKEFSAQIRLACVFGNLGNEALIVTRDDEVFALGSNGAGCLGLGDMHSTLAPKQVPVVHSTDRLLKVEPLCYRRVVGFAYGSGPHVLAFTEGGELYRCQATCTEYCEV